MNFLTVAVVVSDICVKVEITSMYFCSKLCGSVIFQMRFY